MAGASVLTTVICPLIGAILSNIMWFSPWKAVQQVRDTREIGVLNPVPFTAIIANCIGWLLYGYFNQDYFLFFANITGLLVGFYYCISCLTVMAPKQAGEAFSDQYLLTERLLHFAVFFWGVMGLVCSVAFNGFSDSRQQCANFAGLISCAFSISYYAAPLSTMFQVLATRDASSLYFPTILVNCVNGLMWFVYGVFGTGDPMLWVPNGLGFLLCSSQVVLVFLFKKDTMWNTLIGKQAPSPQNDRQGLLQTNSLHSKSSSTISSVTAAELAQGPRFGFPFSTPSRATPAQTPSRSKPKNQKKQKQQQQQQQGGKGRASPYADVDEEALLVAAQDTDGDALLSLSISST